jgi:hypothetical protein
MTKIKSLLLLDLIVGQHLSRKSVEQVEIMNY